MYIFIFILGTIFGSFYLVVGTRLLRNEDIIVKSSYCEYCNTTLSWYNLIPILSYIFQKGKCSNCKTKLPLTYPITELATGLLFMYMYHTYGISYDFYIGIILSSILVLICITDFKEYIILDSTLIGGIILLTMVYYIYFDISFILSKLLSAVALFLLFYSVKLIGNFMYKRESLGDGDIKLAFVIGYSLGFQLALYSIVLSTFLALPTSVATVLITKNKEVPYGPFLAGALLIVYLNMDKFLTL